MGRTLGYSLLAMAGAILAGALLGAADYAAGGAQALVLTLCAGVAVAQSAGCLWLSQMSAVDEFADGVLDDHASTYGE
jgi:biotin transporter BioY